MAKKDKIVTPSVTKRIQELGYSVADWDDSKTSSKLTPEIIEVLSVRSKSAKGTPGYPDRIYCNKREKLLILVEEKPNMLDHNNDDITKGAIAGLLWYLEGFKNNLFKEWKVIGLAVSGNLDEEYQHKFSAFIINNNQEIEPLPQVTNFMTEEQYLALFNNLDEEKAIAEVSRVSKKINNLLRSIDSQKRPILMSSLMIALYKPKGYENNFSTLFKKMNGKQILGNLFSTIEEVLMYEGIPKEKLTALEGELSSMQTDTTLQDTDILNQILEELNETIIPLFESRFSTSSNYDIIGRFYEEFLKYAGVSNVKKGIVLTPRHITTLFTKLIPMKSDDVILDLCCGTGAFLTAAMNKLINMISNSSRTDKDKTIKNIKENQLLGFELNTTMYICALSNMLFRGDGKSRIYNYDSINDKRTDEVIEEVRPTIGFINPPYSGKENKTDPTPKEITFLKKMLDNCSRYGIIIAPLSMYFKEAKVRDNILNKHSLKYVINMPKDLFEPNATSHTSIAVFETNLPHDYDEKVVFYDLRDDGFTLTKHKGRTDIYNKWTGIEKEVLDAIKPSSQPDGVILVKEKIEKRDEWTVYAHLKTDYSTLNQQHFIESITNYLVYRAKKELDLIKEDITMFELINMLINYYPNIDFNHMNRNFEHAEINFDNWKELPLTNRFTPQRGKRLIEADRIAGNTPYFSASEFNNGLTDSIDNPLFIEKNSLIYTTFGDCFFVEEEFTASDEITILKNDSLNLYNGLFISTIINMSKYKFAFGRKAFLNKIDKENIILPVDSNGDIDFNYMESYIKSLPYSEYL